MDALGLLRDGELEVRGRLTVSSNAALVGIVSLPAPTDAVPSVAAAGGLLARLLGDEESPPGRVLAAVVYKPVAFERPRRGPDPGAAPHRRAGARAGRRRPQRAGSRRWAPAG